MQWPHYKEEEESRAKSVVSCTGSWRGRPSCLADWTQTSGLLSYPASVIYSMTPPAGRESAPSAHNPRGPALRLLCPTPTPEAAEKTGEDQQDRHYTRGGRLRQKQTWHLILLKPRAIFTAQWWDYQEWLRAARRTQPEDWAATPKEKSALHTERAWLSPTSGKPWTWAPKPFRLHIEKQLQHRERTPELIQWLSIYQEIKLGLCWGGTQGAGRAGGTYIHGREERRLTRKQDKVTVCKARKKITNATYERKASSQALGQERWSPQPGVPERTQDSKGSVAECSKPSSE